MEVASVEGVTAWLTSLGLPQYNPKFIENEIDGEVLLSLSSEELRDDLLVCNLRHRRKILNEIRILRDQTGDGKPKPLPEHGRILDHLSNTRTYHSWIRVGVQLLGFSIVTLRLAPGFREARVLTAGACYFAVCSVLTFLYGMYRYRLVLQMIEQSKDRCHNYNPDKVGVVLIVTLVLIASAFGFALIFLQPK